MARRRLTVSALVVVVVLGALLVLAAGCGARDALRTVMRRGTIVVATSADYPPYEYVDALTDVYAGLDIDLMNEIARRLGVQASWCDMEADELLAAVQGGRVNAAIGWMAKDEEKATQALFTDEYVVSRDAVLVAADSPLRLTDPAVDFPNLVVGVQSGSTQADWCRRNLVDTDKMAWTNLTLYPRVDEALRELEAGNVDAVFLDEDSADAFAAQGTVRKALVVDLGDPVIAVKLGETALAGRINDIIKQLREEGFIKRLCDKYQVPGH